MRLANKVAIITGAGSGIGRTSAILFAKEGAKIVVADINDAGGQETVAAIKSSGGEAIAIHTDVTIASEVESLGKITKDKFGTVDILFNNAGICRMIPILDIEVAEWDKIMAVNLRGTFLMSREAFRIMKRLNPCWIRLWTASTYTRWMVSDDSVMVPSNSMWYGDCPGKRMGATSTSARCAMSWARSRPARKSVPMGR